MFEYRVEGGSDELFLEGDPVLPECALFVEAVGDLLLVVGSEDHHPPEEYRVKGDYFAAGIKDPAPFSVVKSGLEDRHFGQEEPVY